MAVRGWIGAVLGPVVGTALYLFIRLVNGRRMLTAEPRRPPGSDRWYAVIVIANAKCIPAGAITFGNRIYMQYPDPSQHKKLLDHESVHVEQYHTLGWWRFLSQYGREFAQHGYAHVHFEQEARERAGV